MRACADCGNKTKGGTMFEFYKPYHDNTNLMKCINCGHVEIEGVDRNMKDDCPKCSNSVRSSSYASPASQGVQNGGQDKDITNECEYGSVDGENMPLLKCTCGRKFENWDFILSIYSDAPNKCDCGRRLYFKQDIKIMEVQ